MTTTRSPQIDLGQRTVGEVMRLGVVTCAPDTPLWEVARLMGAYRIHCVVVSGLSEDRQGTRLVWGVVSDLDLVAAATVRDLDDQTAGGTAASPIVMVTPAETLERAAQLMTEHSTSHLIVADVGLLEPVGVISTLDVAAALSGGG